MLITVTMEIITVTMEIKTRAIHWFTAALFLEL